MIYTVLPSPLGPLTAAAEEGALTGLWLEGQKYFAAGLSPAVCRRDDAPVFQALDRWLSDYFAGSKGPCPLPLSPKGSPFQLRVWAALREIPYGTVVTYGDLAQRLGSAPRAVGGAVGRNPISIVVPCHRVVGSGGQLTGYAGGIDRKRFLLELEGVLRP